MINFITWTADPTIIDSFVTVRWYGLAFAVGFIIGYEIVSRIFKHEGVRESWVSSLFVYVVLATAIGSRLGHVFFYEWDYYSNNLLDIFKIWEGGLASHGGTLGIVVAIFLYSKLVTHKSPLWTFDRLVVPVGLVAGLIRFGNLMNHEIYGDVTTLPWGFSFVGNLGAWMQGAEPIFTQPSHPTQIYEAFFYFAVFVISMVMYWKYNAQERPGLIFGVFLASLFTARFFIEFIKNDQEAFEADMLLNMGQILSIPFIVAGIILIIRAYLNPRVKLSFPNKFAPEAKKK